MSRTYTPPGSPYPKRVRQKSERIQMNERPFEPLYRPADHPGGGAPFRTVRGQLEPRFPVVKKPSLRILPQERIIPQNTRSLPPLDPNHPDYVPQKITLGVNVNPERALPLSTILADTTSPKQQAIRDTVLLKRSQIRLYLKWPGYDVDYLMETVRATGTAKHITTGMVVEVVYKMVKGLEDTVRDNELVIKDENLRKWQFSSKLGSRVLRLSHLTHVEGDLYQVHVGDYTSDS